MFFTRAGTGTFYNASGLASLGEKADRSMFGALEPDVYFYGEILEKTGEDRYKITKGGFTTCVQPTPRWELVGGSARINVGDYALLSNAVMRVKDVPIFYLPWMYYPIQDDDRSTGFLLPSYGRSLYQGSSVSNAFFWAMTRSQDLTVMHDWFTQTGQGYGSEYRWMRSATSLGNLRAYKLAQKAATVNGAPVPESRSVLVNGAITQDLPFRLKGRARIDYSSNLTLNQLYSQDIYNATQSLSTWNGNVSGSWRFVNASATAQRTQQFFNETQSRINGSLPSITAAVSSRKLGPLPVYFALQSEAARPIYIERNGDTDFDRSLTRTDLAAQPAHAGQPLAVPEHEPAAELPHHLVQREHGVRPDRESPRPGRRAVHPQLRRAARRDPRSGVQQGLHAQQRLRRPPQARHRAELHRAAHHQHRGRTAGADAGQLLRPRRRRGHPHDLRADEPGAGAQGAAEGQRRARRPPARRASC